MNFATKLGLLATAIIAKKHSGYENNGYAQTTNQRNSPKSDETKITPSHTTYIHAQTKVYEDASFAALE
jgi:hypothetical protein